MSAEFDSEDYFNEEYPFISNNMFKKESKWDCASIPYELEGININKMIFKSNEEMQLFIKKD